MGVETYEGGQTNVKVPIQLHVNPYLVRVKKNKSAFPSRLYFIFSGISTLVKLNLRRRIKRRKHLGCARLASKCPMADSTSYGDGDTYLINDLLPPSLAQDVFEALKKEVSWNVMSHRGMS